MDIKRKMQEANFSKEQIDALGDFVDYCMCQELDPFRKAIIALRCQVGQIEEKLKTLHAEMDRRCNPDSPS